MSTCAIIDFSELTSKIFRSSLVEFVNKIGLNGMAKNPGMLELQVIGDLTKKCY